MNLNPKSSIKLDLQKTHKIFDLKTHTTRDKIQHMQTDGEKLRISCCNFYFIICCASRLSLLQEFQNQNNSFSLLSFFLPRLSSLLFFSLFTSRVLSSFFPSYFLLLIFSYFGVTNNIFLPSC